MKKRTDIGRKFAGAVSGAMNTAGNIGGFICAFLFLKIDPSKSLTEDPNEL